MKQLGELAFALFPLFFVLVCYFFTRKQMADAIRDCRKASEDAMSEKPQDTDRQSG